MLGLLVFCAWYSFGHIYMVRYLQGPMFMQHILDVRSCRIQALLVWFESAMKFWQHSLLGASCQKKARSA